MSYVLEGDSADLKKHVGHRVEITGTSSDSMSGSASGGSTGTTGSGTTAGSTSAGSTTASGGSGSSSSMSGHSGSMGHLRVSSVRMISADCSGSGK
jgi:hypothetical protein